MSAAGKGERVWKQSNPPRPRWHGPGRQDHIQSPSAPQPTSTNRKHHSRLCQLDWGIESGLTSRSKRACQQYCRNLSVNGSSPILAVFTTWYVSGMQWALACKSRRLQSWEYFQLWPLRTVAHRNETHFNNLIQLTTPSIQNCPRVTRLKLPFASLLDFLFTSNVLGRSEHHNNSPLLKQGFFSGRCFKVLVNAST